MNQVKSAPELPDEASPRLASEGVAPPVADRGTWTSGGRLFAVAAFVILSVAAGLRLYELALNPFHHDEGINGFFLTNLVRKGTYTYDPANYHGPTLYYFALVSETLFGLTTEAVRLVPAFFGVATVALILSLRRFIGPIAALTAAALLAVSPGATYVSRYFIHESPLVFFSTAIVVSLLWYGDTRRPILLILASASAALLFATKETGIISVMVLGIAAVVATRFVWLRGGNRPSSGKAGRAAGSGRSSKKLAGPSRRGRGWMEIPREVLVASGVVFLTIYVVFFSSFFANYPQGLVDSLATFTIWTQTGTATQAQPVYAYLVWMLRADAPILILGTLGGLVAGWRGNNRLAVFVGLWALGITAGYSIIKYKTPWIALNMLVPLAILAGLAVTEIARSRQYRRLVPALLAGAMALNSYQAVDLNFVHYDDETYSYVFVHTTRQALSLVNEIQRVATLAGTGEQTGVVFVTPDYWPLPWYFRNYPRAGFFGSIVPTQEAMIVANVNQEAELKPSIAGRYRRVGVYNLRPGVDLVLYVRRDLPL